MRRIAIILAGIFLLAGFFCAAAALGERPEMPPIGEVAPQPPAASTMKAVEIGGASSPTMPSIHAEPMPEVDEPPAAISAETHPAETIPATEPKIISETPPETQAAEEVTSAPATLPAAVDEAPEKAELQYSFVADHPSGIYFAKEEGKISVIVELPAQAKEAQALGGKVVFKAVPIFGQPDKPLSITPILPSEIKPGKRVKLTVSVTFPAPGEYVLIVGKQWVKGAGGVALRCVFAPRGAEGKAIDNSWVTTLPPAASEIPGFIADYVKRTGTRRFVLDETWGPALTPEVKVLTKGRRELLLKNLAEAKAQLILRLGLTSAATNEPRSLLTMNRYVSKFVLQAKGSIAAVCLNPSGATAAPADVERVRQYYFSIYDAVKKQNKSTLMLGTSSIGETEMFLTSPAKGENLRGYIDVLCASDSAADVKKAMDKAAAKEWKGAPVWVLPHGGGMATAAVKSLTPAVVPIDPADRNVPAHLLGGSAHYERLHPESLPFVAIFQGDGFAVAAIAGPGAGTLLDLPHRQNWGPRVEFDKPAFVDAAGKSIEPHLEIGDDTNSMRVVDARGGAVDCRTGDLLKVPLGDEMYYVLATGAADDLASLLRVATPFGVAIVDPEVKKFTSPTPAEKGSLGVSILNVSAADVQGEAVLVGADGEVVGAAQKFAAISPGKEAEVSFVLPAGLATDNLRVEFRFKGVKQVQRNKLKMGK